MKIDTTGIEVREVELMNDSVIQIKFIEKTESGTYESIANLKPIEFMESFTEDEELSDGSVFTHQYVKMAVFGKYVSKIDNSKPKYMSIKDIENKLGHKVYITG